MQRSTQLIVALVSAIGAAIANSTYLESRLHTEQFAVAARQLRRGQAVAREDLKSLSLAGDLDEFKRQLVPWDRINEIIGQQLNRDLMNGEFLQESCIMQPNRTPPGTISIFVPTDSLPRTPPYLLPGSKVSFRIRRTGDSMSANNAADVREIGPFTIDAMNGNTTAQSDGESTSNRSPILTIVASEKDDTPDSAVRLLRDAAAQNGWKLIDLVVKGSEKSKPSR